jgi:sodium/proline symporter
MVQLQFNIWIVVAFGVYCALMVAIGAVGFRRTKTTDDYIIGGRSLGAFVGALSAEAADMSAWLFMGLPGAIYLSGIGKGWIAVGLLLGTTLNWLLVAKRLNKCSAKQRDSATLPGFFSSTLSSRAVGLVTALVLVVFFTVYVASGFVAGGKFFSLVFHTSYFSSMLITALVIILYTFLGGFLSISWTSAVQGCLMFISVLVVPIAAVVTLGGFGPAFATTDALTAVSSGGNDTSALEIISNLAWGLGYFGMPHIIIKYMAIKSERTIRKSSVIAISWCALSLGFAVLIGLVGRNFVGPNTLVGADSENLFIHMISNLFIDKGGFVLHFLGGLFLCAILSAIMSTAATQLLMSSSSVSVDIYQKFLKPKSADKSVLNLSRVVVLLVALVGFAIALDPNSSIMELVSDAWAGFGASFGPLVLLILYSKKVTKEGAVAGIISGGLIVLLWKYLPILPQLYSLVPGFIISGIVIVLVSHFTREKEVADAISA